jgi:hypothetical protein
VEPEAKFEPEVELKEVAPMKTPRGNKKKYRRTKSERMEYQLSDFLIEGDIAEVLLRKSISYVGYHVETSEGLMQKRQLALRIEDS